MPLASLFALSICLLLLARASTRATYDSVHEWQLSARRSKTSLLSFYFFPPSFASLRRFRANASAALLGEREPRSALPETCALLCPDVHDVTERQLPGAHGASAGPSGHSVILTIISMLASFPRECSALPLMPFFCECFVLCPCSQARCSAIVARRSSISTVLIARLIDISISSSSWLASCEQTLFPCGW